MSVTGPTPVYSHAGRGDFQGGLFPADGGAGERRSDAAADEV